MGAIPAGILFSAFCVGTLAPLWMLVGRAFADQSGTWIGAGNFRRYFADEGLFQSFWNTAWVSGATAGATLLAGLAFSWGMVRVKVPGKIFLRVAALSPLFAPSLLHGIALTYLFGNQGLVTTGCFGHLPGLRIPLYGPLGIAIGEGISTFPAVVLLLSVALSQSDRDIHDAARTMGASRWRIFFTVTLPSIRQGLVGAFFSSFAGAFTDFGVPKVLGGSFRVLSVEIYKQVVGLQNLPMGAAISLLLATPTLLAFVVDRRTRGREGNLRSVPLEPGSGPVEKGLFSLVCWTLAAGIALVDGVVLYASLVKTWPYDLHLGLSNYDFSGVAGFGQAPFATSLRMAALTCLFGASLAFLTAWILERTRLLGPIRPVWKFLSLLPMSLPGMVIGLAYIFFFNAPLLGVPPFTVGNPFHPLYGGMAVLVMANIWHFFPVSMLAFSTVLRRLDPDLENVARTLGSGTLRTLRAVTFPLCGDAFLEAATYLFVNSMITVSALVFLFSADLRPAALSVVDMEDAGDVAPAAAMGVLIFATNLGLILLRHGVSALVARRRARLGAVGT
jgi:iron(III) transport system permease protein